MDRLFSVDDSANDQFWSPVPVAQSSVEEESSASSASKMMNRSASEWVFQVFLQEASSALDSSPPPPSSSKPVTVDNDIVEIKNNCNQSAAAAFAAGPPNVPIDSEEYQAYLKSRLDLACAAVALTRASSQRELSDDDELQGQGKTETTQNMNPADAKRVRRMLSNRESASRSRKRKQAHLTELETRVSELSAENSSLVKRLTDITQEFNEAAVDNRVLKADVETLKAKLKMAQETVTGSNALFLPMSEISTIGMTTSFDGTTSAAVPVQDDPKQHFYQPAPNNHTHTHDQRIQSSLLQISPLDDSVQHNPATPPVDGNKMGRTPSMQRVASLEHLQKQINGGIISCGTQCSGEQ